MLEYNMAAILESKRAAILGFIFTYLGFPGGKEPNSSAGLHTNFLSWWPDRATKIINYQFLVARTGNLVARKKKSEMNGGNIWLRMTLKINVGCLSLASEMNGGNIRVRMTLRINVGCLLLWSEINYGNIRLRMTLK